MTDTSTVSSTSSTSGLTSTTAESVSALSENYELFLTILTTQLQNQNPLDPTDTDELTSQLIQYSQVEQQILANQYLETLVLATNNQAAETALSFMGMEVTYNGEDQTFEGEELSWSFDMPDGVTSAVVQLSDADGHVVYTDSLDATAGEASFTWDGTTTDGSTAEDGTYTLSVIATYEDGTSEEIELTGTSTVTEVDWSSGSPVLKLANGAEIDLSDIVSATQPQSAAA
ncbi:flagellar hook assembly protein FlgD [Roseospirillum parvum]|uniref:Basal-body rod modification protein FlgD n=1 Tax=Roseospirillum parvum TaxID=83401 RepID=A0A1G8ANN0_9PROT|nr:flagellar hook assembly protein FlgD [Roseospirillum parvum]SDH22463.1 flagellar basal-body rod modification protein FlgD [Roseospirillum parvum]